MRNISTLAILALALWTAPALAASAIMGGGVFNHTVGAQAGAGDTQSDTFPKAIDLIRQEKYADAIPLLRQLHEQSPHNADVLSLLGLAYLKTNDNDRAQDYLQRALSENPDHKRAHQYLGEFYLSTHDLASAQGQLAELTRICQSGCDNKDVLSGEIATYQTANAAAPASKPAGSN